MTHYRPRSEPRRERAQEREAALTSTVLDYGLAFFHRRALHRLSLQASSSHRPIAHDRRGLLLGRCTVNNPA